MTAAELRRLRRLGTAIAYARTSDGVLQFAREIAALVADVPRETVTERRHGDAVFRRLNVPVSIEAFERELAPLPKLVEAQLNEWQARLDAAFEAEPPVPDGPLQRRLDGAFEAEPRPAPRGARIDPVEPPRPRPATRPVRPPRLVLNRSYRRGAPPTSNPDDDAAIARFIAEKGVTECPAFGVNVADLEWDPTVRKWARRG